MNRHTLTVQELIQGCNIDKCCNIEYIETKSEQLALQYQTYLYTEAQDKSTTLVLIQGDVMIECQDQDPNDKSKNNNIHNTSNANNIHKIKSKTDDKHKKKHSTAYKPFIKRLKHAPHGTKEICQLKCIHAFVSCPITSRRKKVKYMIKYGFDTAYLYLDHTLILFEYINQYAHQYHQDKWIQFMNELSSIRNNSRIFSCLDSLKGACKGGHLDLVKSILETKRIQEDEWQQGFECAIYKGHVPIVEYITLHCNVANDPNTFDNCLCPFTCRDAKTLDCLIKYAVSKKMDFFTSNALANAYYLSGTCDDNDDANRIMNELLDIQEENYILSELSWSVVLEAACKSGCTHTVKMAIHLAAIYEYPLDYSCGFVGACYHGNPTLINWMYKKCHEQNQIIPIQCLKRALLFILRHDLNTIKRVFKMNKSRLANIDWNFIIRVHLERETRLSLVQYLLAQAKKHSNTPLDLDSIFKSAYENKHYDICRYLVSQVSNGIIEKVTWHRAGFDTT
jgi:hypothetical protein